MAKVMRIDVGTTNSYVAIVQNDQPLDPQVQLLIPEGDVDDPEISIVIPAMNERITIEDFVEWCKMGLGKGRELWTSAVGSSGFWMRGLVCYHDTAHFLQGPPPPMSQAD